LRVAAADEQDNESHERRDSRYLRPVRRLHVHKMMPASDDERWLGPRRRGSACTGWGRDRAGGSRPALRCAAKRPRSRSKTRRDRGQSEV